MTREERDLSLTLTVHRGTRQIGGSCIEIAHLSTSNRAATIPARPRPPLQWMSTFAPASMRAWRRMTTLTAFLQSLDEPGPPAGLAGPLLALWHAEKGEWDAAHRIVMNDDSREAAWVHACLHREEGDLGNAGYWYSRAGQPVADGLSEAERRAIAEALTGGR